MLKKEQVLASEWVMLELEGLELRLMEAFPKEPERRRQSKEALHFYDAFLGITDASIHTAFTSKSLTAFKGFLAAEFDMPRAEFAALVWTVGEFHEAFGMLTGQDTHLALNHDDAVAQRAYRELSPIPDRIRYYRCWFNTRCGPFFIDLCELSSRLSESSQQFLSDRLASYMKDKELYDAQTDAELICSILQGYISKWPGRELSNTISKKQTSTFIGEIKSESNRQMAFAGFTRSDAKKNLSLVTNVIRHFFTHNGIFADADSLQHAD